MLQNYRNRVESFLERLVRERYNFRMEAGAGPDLQSLYSEYSDLHHPETIGELKGELAAIPDFLSRRRKSVRKLIAFAVWHHLKAGVLGLERELSDGMSRGQLVWDGEAMSLAAAWSRLETEPERDQREGLYRALCAERSKWKSEHLLRIRGIAAGARRLGYANLLELFKEINPVNPADVHLRARKYLGETQASYESQLAGVLRGELHSELSDVRPADLIYLRRLCACDGFYPARKRLRAYGETLDRLGIDLTQQKNLWLEEGAEASGSPGAACFAIRVPAEVVLFLTPAAGRGAYERLLGAGARCQLYAWTGTGADIENRCCGDRALAATYAALFTGLLEEPHWLLDRLGIANSENLLIRQRLVRLMEMRRQAALSILSAEWISSPDWSEEILAGRHLQVLSEALICRFEESDWLMDIDELPGSPDRFRASLLAASFQEYLRTRYSSDWYSERQAGRLFKELWETGELYSAEELAREVGFYTATETESLESSLRGVSIHEKH
jgi:hypothetical protein